MVAPLKPAPLKPAGAKPALRKTATRKVVAGPQRSDMRLVIWVAAAIFLVDQALKYLVVHVLNLDRVRAIDVFPPWLNLRMAWNQGVNFGLMSSETDMMRWVLIAIAVVICIWVWVWVWRANLGRFARISAGLLIGGALGNVVDRIMYGAVADFLNMSLPGWQNPYSFNVADISIFAGAIGLVLMPQPKPAPPVKTRGAAKQPARTGPKPRPKAPPLTPPTTPPTGPVEPHQPDLFTKPDQQGRDGDEKPG